MTHDGLPQLQLPELTPNARLFGKVAIVTGAGSAGPLVGGGAAISILFAACGASVVLLDRDESRALHTLRAIESIDGRAGIVQADITDSGACRAAVNAAVEQFGAVDVLVNNAAIAPSDNGTDELLWDNVLRVNLTGAKSMIDAVTPHMAHRGRGSIINIGSTAGLRGGGGIAYSAAKSGLIGLTHAMAFAHGRSGIRVNTIAPGHMHTPMGMGLNRERRMRAAAGLIDVEGTGWDVAYACVFLASDEARWITGVTLPVDGGTTQAMPLRMFPHLAQAAAETDGS